MAYLSRFSLEGKVALITGSSRGIGRSAALAFAEAGADIALTSRKQEDLDKVAAEIEALGRKALPVAAHVGKIDQVNKLVETVVARFGKIDILVNNAGSIPANAICLDAEERLYDNIMNLFVKGVYFLSQSAGRIMKEKGGGKIINVTSVDSVRPEYGNGIYAAAKAAVAMLTKSMALELAQYNIRVNAIAPGVVNTKLLALSWTTLPEEEGKKVKAALSNLNPMKRLGEPDEIAGAMLYLASDASSYTTGQTIVVDGGQLQSGGFHY
jgi:NAD(P)-dependent dehydrogenase (short-subunit alcohol dehydrogenase family)